MLVGQKKLWLSLTNSAGDAFPWKTIIDIPLHWSLWKTNLPTKGVVDSKLLGVAKAWYEKGYFIVRNKTSFWITQQKTCQRRVCEGSAGKMASIQLRSMVIWKAPMCYLERRKPLSLKPSNHHFEIIRCMDHSEHHPFRGRKDANHILQVEIALLNHTDPLNFLETFHVGCPFLWLSWNRIC